MPRRERQQLKILVQQRQEQQRATAASTPKPGAAGPQEQQDAPIRQAFTGFDRATEVSFTAPTVASIPFPVGVTLSPGYTAPAKTAGGQVEAALARLRPPDPLTPAQEAALDLLDQLAGDIALHAHHSHLDELIRRLPDLGEACGLAVRNALRETQ